MKLLEIVDDEIVNVIEVDPENIPDWASSWPRHSGAMEEDVGSKKEAGAWVHRTRRPEVVEPIVRNHRDQLLIMMDVVVGNNLRWGDMSEEKQAEWSVYRQALLDVPQQSGFPLDVVWPEKPA